MLRSLFQTISAKAMDCLWISSRRVTTTNWCCLSFRGYPTKWTLLLTFAHCCPTRASTPCSWTRTPSWSRCCWRTPASSTTVRCEPRSSPHLEVVSHFISCTHWSTLDKPCNMYIPFGKLILYIRISVENGSFHLRCPK